MLFLRKFNLIQSDLTFLLAKSNCLRSGNKVVTTLILVMNHNSILLSESLVSVKSAIRLNPSHLYHITLLIKAACLPVF